MSKRASADHPVHELIAARWSPYGFSNRTVSEADLRSLFEAARWAASSYNEQPWSYIVATRSDEAEFQKMLACLVEPNQEWARAVPVLALGVMKRAFERNGKPNGVALHDLGLASANLTLAIGYAAEQAELPEAVKKHDLAPRTRKPLREFVFGGRWTKSAEFLPE